MNEITEEKIATIQSLATKSVKTFISEGGSPHIKVLLEKLEQPLDKERPLLHHNGNIFIIEIGVDSGGSTSNGITVCVPFGDTHIDISVKFPEKTVRPKQLIRVRKIYNEFTLTKGAKLEYDPATRTMKQIE
jgi:hypothetical protein